MAYCSECGAEIGSQETVCGHCGADLNRRHEGGDRRGNDAPEAHRRGERSRDRRHRDQTPQDRRQQRPDGRRSKRERSEQRRGERRGERGGRGQRTDQRGDDRRQRPRSGSGGLGSTGRGGSGTSRRRLLAVGGGVASVVALGGGVLLLGGGSAGGPKGTAKKFVRHMTKDDTAAANGMIHPDAPLGRVNYGIGISGFSASVGEATLLEETEESAKVRVDYEFSAGDYSQDKSATVELRKHQGNWKVWEFDE